VGARNHAPSIAAFGSGEATISRKPASDRKQNSPFKYLFCAMTSQAPVRCSYGDFTV
jgi:hypothetical protein